jgi:peptidoglycan/xylan/chitin deacetylase (PgdA/CDA1 family)
MIRQALALLHKTRIFDLGIWAAPRRLTVINYHRVTDLFDPEFATFKPNVSATPAQFEQQMAYVAQHFNPIGIGDLTAWLAGQRDLPVRAALITFDDGYADNYTQAAPILKKHHIPGLIFLTSGYIDGLYHPHWDVVSLCFRQTRLNEAVLPVLGRQSWSSPLMREKMAGLFIEALKALPDEQRLSAVEQLTNVLGETVPDSAFQGLMMSWDQIRELIGDGIDFGAHTVSHPILTRISPEHALEEMQISRKRIQEETGQSVDSFAYPNGKRPDFKPEIQNLVRKAGFKTAFTLMAGPLSYRKARQAPFAIQRIFISHKDDLPRFAAKLNGLSKLREM